MKLFDALHPSVIVIVSKMFRPKIFRFAEFESCSKECENGRDCLSRVRVCAEIAKIFWYSGSPDASDTRSQWRAGKKSFLNPFESVSARQQQSDKEFMGQLPCYTSKKGEVEAWIESLACEVGSEVFATKTVCILPWDTVVSLHQEYVFHHQPSLRTNPIA